MSKRYNNDYMSVTEVLDFIRKPGLEYWFKHHTPQECDEISSTAKQVGTQIHAVIEAFVLNKPCEFSVYNIKSVASAIESFKKFSREVVKDFSVSEMKLKSDKYQLNGTIDCIKYSKEYILGEEKELATIIDWKTGECKEKEKPPIYEQYLLQVSAYAQLFEENFPEKKVIGAHVVSLAKDKAGVYNHIHLTGNDLRDIFFDCFYPLLQFVKAYKKIGGQN